ncbi:MAG: SprT family zinc-dependent metalloprotease [Rubrobacter sp.]|nr:M48 family metallopeptidase [Rubrobacteraceae bacterium]MDQ3251013.1 M48 family metallopeptidase [Actinomycetota bacterium]MDQ3437387.1 M48 family metallopeptidase [Actinomycetota bacterium]
MSISRRFIEVGGIRVEVVRKPIKNLHLSVHPPDGRVRVSAPSHIDDEAVRLAVVSKLSWIRRHQKTFADQPRQSQREMISGESHYFLGRRYRLNVTERNGPNRVTLNGTSELTMQLRPGTDRDRREQLLNAWYRRRMKELVPDLIAKWQPIIGVEVADWGIKKMKTRWGSCNTRDNRVWLNLELAKKSLNCIEYVLVHEMVHLLERNHSEHFKALMDKFLPQWQLYRDELNQAPLSYEEWVS